MNVSAERLRAFIERIERLNEEAKGLRDDIKEVFSEAKGQGYDVPTMRALIKRRAMESHKRQEADALLATYRAALGDGPLFNAPDDLEPTPIERAASAH